MYKYAGNKLSHLSLTQTKQNAYKNRIKAILILWFIGKINQQNMLKKLVQNLS